jgi:hypothetical protein
MDAISHIVLPCAKLTFALDATVLFAVKGKE